MKRIIAIIITIATFAAVLTGCSKNEPTVTPVINPNATATVIGVANCVNSTICNPELLQKMIAESCQVSGSTVSVCEIDGNPYEVYSEEITYPSGYTKQNIQSLFDTYCMEISNAIEEAAPKTAEVDLLQGFNVLSNSLNMLSYDRESKLNCIIISNLLSTTGKLNLCQSTLYFSVDKYADYLQAHMPSFKGIKTLKWIVTDYSGTQEKLEKTDITRLEDLYAKLLTNAGVNKVEFIPANAASIDDIDQSSWCDVTPIEVRHSTFEADQAEANVVDIVLDSNVLFKSDSTGFVNEKQVKETLQSLVDSINQSQGVVIAGSTATTVSSREIHREFSLSRAKKVKSVLVSLGADSEKITCVGLGKDKTSYRVPDSLEGDSSNRTVFITTIGTAKAQEFLKIGLQA